MLQAQGSVTVTTMQSSTTRSATPASVKEGQISRENIIKLLTMMNGEGIDWDVARSIVIKYDPTTKGDPNIDEILRLTLGQACLVKSSLSYLELVLQKIKRLSLKDRVFYAFAASQRATLAHLKALVNDDPSVLFFDPGESMPLLHRICASHTGWNNQVQFLLKAILENRNQDGGESERNHKGLFEEAGEEKKTLLDLLIESGSDLVEIIEYLRDEHPDYLKANLIHVANAIAEYLSNMTILLDCITLSEDALLFSSHPKEGSSVLGLACHYQNDRMVHALCHQYFQHYRFNLTHTYSMHECLIHLQNHFIAPNNKGISPLGDILLSVSSPDADFAWACIDAIVRFFGLFNEYTDGPERIRGRFRFHVLHLFLLHTWDKILEKKDCIKIFDRVIDRFEINLCSVEEETGKTLLSIAIEKMAGNITTDDAIEKTAADNTASDTKSKHEVSMEILDYFINPTAAAAPNPPATIRNGCGRLPLHLACEHSLAWNGLETIVNANMPAMESVDPITGLPPFAHCAVGERGDLDSIYELLRLHPDSIDGVTIDIAIK